MCLMMSNANNCMSGLGHGSEQFIQLLESLLTKEASQASLQHDDESAYVYSTDTSPGQLWSLYIIRTCSCFGDVLYTDYI